MEGSCPSLIAYVGRGFNFGYPTPQGTRKRPLRITSFHTLPYPSLHKVPSLMDDYIAIS